MIDFERQIEIEKMIAGSDWSPDFHYDVLESYEKDEDSRRKWEKFELENKIFLDEFENFLFKNRLKILYAHSEQEEAIVALRRYQTEEIRLRELCGIFGNEEEKEKS